MLALIDDDTNLVGAHDGQRTIGLWMEAHYATRSVGRTRLEQRVRALGRCWCVLEQCGKVVGEHKGGCVVGIGLKPNMIYIWMS